MTKMNERKHTNSQFRVKKNESAFISLSPRSNLVVEGDKIHRINCYIDFCGKKRKRIIFIYIFIQ